MPEQMIQYLEDDRDGHLYGKHVVAVIQNVQNLSTKPEGAYNMREVMASFVTKLMFWEMCVVLKEQKGWRQIHLTICTVYRSSSSTGAKERFFLARGISEVRKEADPLMRSRIEGEGLVVLDENIVLSEEE
ncbi:hypothetical protein NE237_013456 [Protea cynaroides]|uniref:Uncharacterized protein n=1 Tax=Protea cynaroides TaxID=273540 RepID=A0A9Q0K074_9MAGN|nr:hypothetical protein NE237_013456 [Protea cynaroides]